MNMDFEILDFKKDLQNRTYTARISFDGIVGNYEIKTNANIRYLDWITNVDMRLSVLNGFDLPFNGDPFFIHMKRMDSFNPGSESVLERKFLEYVLENFSEGGH
jgi:hypothetical protein